MRCASWQLIEEVAGSGCSSLFGDDVGSRCTHRFRSIADLLIYNNICLHIFCLYTYCKKIVSVMVFHAKETKSYRTPRTFLCSEKSGVHNNEVGGLMLEKCQVPEVETFP